MSKYNAIKTATNAYIKANGRREISGPILNAILNALIDSLGKYYQFVGLAEPSTNPGTPDQNVAYVAITAGTYTNFGGAVVGDGELTLLTYDGEWHKQMVRVVPDKTSQLSNDTGFITNAVNDLVNYYTKTNTYNKDEVDQLIAAIKQFRFETVDTLPTASASTMYIIYLVPSSDPAASDVKDEWITIESGGVYSWEKIGRTTIDLSNYPTKSEMNTAIDLALSTYINGVDATIDANIGTPAVDISFSNGTIHFAFHNLKGAQGNTGSSVDYPYELVNNLTTNDATKGLSAAQGVQLKSEIDQLELKVYNDMAALLPATVPDGFFLTDELLNVVMKYTQDGFDAAKVSAHFIQALLEAGFFGDSFAVTNEDGFAVVDENLNIGFIVDNGGARAKNIYKAEIINE